ncbi:MAG: sugar O-acetyltransferase [bacterium]|nr:sugar O-acetyltransferase [bacterium]
MKLQEFLEYLDTGKEVVAGSEVHQFMCQTSIEAIKLTLELNNTFHTPEEIREIFSKLIGRPVDETFNMFPPFYTDCGKNIHIGKNVFINAGCKFQDQGGIVLGDGALIGHNVLIVTLNHNMIPEKRANLLPKPVHIGKNAWIGSNVTILPGVTIGDGAIVAAGAVVTKDVASNMVVGGNPARVIREVEEK